MVGGIGPVGGGSPRRESEGHPWTQERQAPSVPPWLVEGGPYYIRYRAVMGHTSDGERVLHVAIEYRRAAESMFTRVGLAACGADYHAVPGSVSFEAGPWHEVCQEIARRERGA